MKANAYYTLRTAHFGHCRVLNALYDKQAAQRYQRSRKQGDKLGVGMIRAKRVIGDSPDRRSVK
jgi:hypothetical protein